MPRFWLALLAFSIAMESRGFNYFEHRYIGNRAYSDASARHAATPFGSSLQRANERLRFGKMAEESRNPAGRLLNLLPLQFGDLSALAGDYSRDPDDLLEVIRKIGEEVEHDPSLRVTRAQALIIDSRRQWLSACRWIYRTRISPHGAATRPLGIVTPISENMNECFGPLERNNFAAPALHHFGSEGYRASREELAEHEKIPQYVTLVSQNRGHFPRHSWKNYSDFHSRALELAYCFRDKSECAPWIKGAGDDLLVDAIINEAFAQHYLHDSFASGHIGTEYGYCGFRVICLPTKARVQQTHDALNELGLKVTLISAPPYSYLDHVRTTVAGGWTAFGDDHLFIAEADFHRALLLATASASLSEIFDAASGSKNSGAACEMCTTRIFPMPERTYWSASTDSALPFTDLTADDYPVGDLAGFESTPSLWNDYRSRDARVPGIPDEGWKVGVAGAFQFRGYKEGQSRWSRPPVDGGMLLKMDYTRSTGSYLPSALGFEFWNIPDRGASYLFTAGYVWPPEITLVQIAIKAKFGWRTEENFTPNNASTERRGGLQFSFPALDVNYELYRPFSLFVHINMYSYIWRGSRHVQEYIRHGEYTSAIGARILLSGI